MPHIVFDKQVDLQELLVNFEPIFEQNNSIIKITDMYMNYNTWSALFFVTIVGHEKCDFFIEVSTRNSKTTIRLFSSTDPKKTNEVKRSLVLVYDFIRKYYENISVTKTNLEKYFITSN